MESDHPDDVHHALVRRGFSRVVQVCESERN